MKYKGVRFVFGSKFAISEEAKCKLCHKDLRKKWCWCLLVYRRKPRPIRVKRIYVCRECMINLMLMISNVEEFAKHLQSLLATKGVDNYVQ